MEGKDEGLSNRRVFVKLKDQTSGIASGKVIIIKKDWTFATLLTQLGRKFDLQITDVFLEHFDTHTNKINLLVVEDIDEIREGDTILISGLQVFEEENSEPQIQIEDKKGEISHQPTSLAEVNTNMVLLTHQISKLVSRIQDSNFQVEDIYKHMSKSLELQQQQLAEMLKTTKKISNNEEKPKSVKSISTPPSLPPVVGGFKQVTTLKEHTGPIWDLKLTSDLLISGSSDKTIKVWDLTTFKLIKTLEGHTGIVHCLGIHKGKLISGSDDKSIRVWSLNEMKCINALYGHDNTICELEVTDKYLFSGSFNLILVWDVEKFQILTSLGGHNHWAYSMCLYNNFLISGSHNMIKVWDMDTLKPVKTINTGGKSIYSLAITDKYLLAGTYENTIHVYNLKNFEFIKRLSEHQACVLSLSVSGQYFFSGSYDTTIKIWGLESLHVVETLHHEAKVEALVANHKYIISGGTDNTIKIWEWKSRPSN